MPSPPCDARLLAERTERRAVPSSSTDVPAQTAISDAVSRLFLEKFGKGPMHVETLLIGDVALALMRDVLTVAERTLLAQGSQDVVLTTRMLWQRATEDMFRQEISQATGRLVLNVISGFDLDHDLASEVFVFAPA